MINRKIKREDDGKLFSVGRETDISSFSVLLMMRGNRKEKKVEKQDRNRQ